MKGKHWYVVCALILSLLAGPGARAQAPSIPPDIQAIINKLKSGQGTTPAEAKRLQEWSKSMSAAASGGGANNASAASAGTTAPAAASLSQSSIPCPPASASLITATAPTRAEYVALVKSLAETYGKGLGTHRAEFDRIFAEHSPSSSPAQSAGVLYMSGAASASVYASAVAAVASPDDLQVASNLGVALDSIPDAKSASAVLLYAHKLAPQQTMPALNLAWVYFNSGHATEAKALFQNAAVLAPDLAGPSAGLGMLASCQGDTATATIMLRKSLSKSYSGVVAVGYKQAQQAEEQKQQDSTEPPPSFPPSGSDDSGPLPEMPATADPQKTLGSETAFQQAWNFVENEVQAVLARFQDAQARVSAINRRAQIDPDGTIDLPRTFDKQIFEYRQIVMLTVGTVQQVSFPTLQQAMGVIGPLNEQDAKAGGVDMDTLLRLQKEQAADAEAHSDAFTGIVRQGLPPAAEAAAIDAEDARYRAQLAPLQQQGDDLAYKMCKRTKGNLETNYAQWFKVWKQYSDSSRASSRDFYAYSQPIIDQIWVPSLNELIQADRELHVLPLYRFDAQGALVIAGLAKGLHELKCVEPQPPGPPKTIKDPTLTKKEPDCPLKPPLNLNFVVAKMELGCDHVKISGGEILRVEVERQFGKSTTVWVGVGVTGSLPGLGASDESLGVSENGKSWSPPGVSVGASATAQSLVGFRIGENGQLDDVMFKSTVQVGGNIGPVSGALGVTGTISLENGPSITPVSKVSYGK